MYKISIIIVTYNSKSYINNCLDTVKQELDLDCEVIIIDNASTDGTPEFIQVSYPWIKLTVNKMNLGFAPACNQGGNLASGQFLVFLNPDTEVIPGWLLNLIKPLVDNSLIGLTTSKILLQSDPTKINTCGLNLHFTGLSFFNGFKENSSSFSKLQVVASVSGASFAIRSDLWRELKGFDETFFMYFEETDLSWRAQLHGYTSICTPESIICHTYNPRPGNFRIYYSERNRWIMLIKNWRLSTILIIFPGLLLAEFSEWIFLVMRSKGSLLAKIHSYKWLLGNISIIIKAHRDVQADRKVPDHEILQNLSYRLYPVEYTGGRIGSLLIQGLNFLFHVLYSCILFTLHLLNQ